MITNINNMEFLRDLPDSKITQETFSGKRFERYVEKTQQSVLDVYVSQKYKRQISHAMVLKSPSQGYPVKSLTDFIVSLFQSYHHPLIEQFSEENHVIYTSLRQYACPNPDLQINKDFLQTYVLNTFSDYNGFVSMVEEEIRLSCMKLIIMKSELNHDIDNTNYFITIPKTLEECALFFIDVINGVHLSLEHLFSSNTAKAMTEFVSDEATREIYNDLEKMKNDVNLLHELVDEKDETISSLKRKISSLEKQLKEQSTHKQVQHYEIMEHNFQLSRQNQKLKEKYQRLLHKKLNIENKEQIDINESIETINDLDLNGKYLFIGFDKNGFQEQILKHLPYARFQDTNADIHSRTDMVVMLTKHITHPTCLGVKEQCKNKGIPLVYCKHSNVELIKDLMWNHIN